MKSEEARRRVSEKKVRREKGKLIVSDHPSSTFQYLSTQEREKKTKHEKIRAIPTDT